MHRRVRDPADPASWQQAGYTVSVMYFPADDIGDALPDPADAPDHVVVRIFTGDHSLVPDENRLVADAIGADLDEAMARLEPATAPPVTRTSSSKIPPPF